MDDQTRRARAADDQTVKGVDWPCAWWVEPAVAYRPITSLPDDGTLYLNHTSRMHHRSVHAVHLIHARLSYLSMRLPHKCLAN